MSNSAERALPPLPGFSADSIVRAWLRGCRGGAMAVGHRDVMVYNMVMDTVNMGTVKINVAEVKAKLSEYLDRAQAGERIVICRHNTPVAELRALEQDRLEPRPVGPLPGRPAFTIAQSFFDGLPEDELGLWESDRDVPQLTRTAAGTMRVAERKATFEARAKRTPRRRKS